MTITLLPFATIVSEQCKRILFRDFNGFGTGTVSFHFFVLVVVFQGFFQKSLGPFVLSLYLKQLRVARISVTDKKARPTVQSAPTDLPLIVAREAVILVGSVECCSVVCASLLPSSNGDSSLLVHDTG